MKQFYIQTLTHNGHATYCLRDTLEPNNLPIIVCESLDLINAACNALNAANEYERAR